MKKSQRARVLDYMIEHGSITRLDAYNDLGITELPKRVQELKETGIPIDDQWIQVQNRFGEKCRVKSYSLGEIS